MVQTIHEIEWHVLEDERNEEAQWPPLVDNAGPSPQLVTVPQLQHLYELFFLTVAFLGVVAGLLWHRADQRIVQLEADLLALNTEFAQTADPVAVNHTNRSGSNTSWLNSSGINIVRNDSPPAYIFEGEHLRFEASVDTAATVENVVRPSERYYRQLREEMGLSMTAQNPKVTLVIGLGSRSLDGDPKAILLSRPVTASRIHGIAEVEALEQEIFTRLAIHTLHEVRTQRVTKAPWQSFVEGLYLYIARENGYDADWKVHDIYLERRHKAQGQSIDVAISIPNTFANVDEQWMAQHSPAENIVDPLIEYILATYGNAVVPKLFDAFAEHTTWETLTPDLFGVTAAQFEAEWHEYLRSTYPLVSD